MAKNIIDLENFKDNDTKGLVGIVRTSNSLGVSLAKFDSNTGDRIEDEVREVNLQEYEDERAKLLKRISDLDGFIDKCNNATLT